MQQLPPTALLVETIARSWMQIEASFATPDSWRSFSGQLLALLRALDDSAADTALAGQRIDSLFATVPAARDILEQALGPKPLRSPILANDGLQSPWGKKPEMVREPASTLAARLQRHTLVSVLFGTDRVRSSAAGARPRYNDERANELSLGVATVSIPDTDHHKKGRLERPRWYRLEFRENPDKHVVITTLSELDEGRFVVQARKARELDDSAAEALVFIHGFNVDFEESIRRTAQFVTDLEFGGVGIAYSWPSKGSVFGYAPDANVSESSMFRLADFIALLRSRLGLERVHLVAHSMGNRLLARALNQHVLRAPPPPLAELNQVVFAAPDIDPLTFRDFAHVFAGSCKRCTLYTSTHDLALTVSRWIYRSKRAGASIEAVLTNAVDAIDVSRVDDSMIGHSYFSDKRELLQDLNELLKNGLAPGERFGMTEVRAGEGHYWQFKA
jgi:esterase/lipase superfamily enzyme